MEYSVKGNVRGRVQGVSFRAFVREKAEQRNLKGWAKNLEDGSVEVVLQGDRKAVNLVQHLVSEGPPRADVRSLHWSIDEYRDIDDFSIR